MIETCQSRHEKLRLKSPVELLDIKMYATTMMLTCFLIMTQRFVQCAKNLLPIAKNGHLEECGRR